MQVTLPLCLTLLLFARARAQDEELVLTADGAVVIKQIEWGFDGKATQHTFTPLSVLVQNNSAAPVSGTLRLTKHIQLNQRIDAEYVQTYFVSGFSSRWVQLTPLVMEDYETWTLVWGEGRNERAEIPTPRTGDRATVLMHDPSDLQSAGGVLRRCDQALFPVSVTATDGLRGVVFDRAPDWQGAREQAFLEWLQLGGRVYLLNGPDGSAPNFTGELSVLNQPDDRFRVGSGLVLRIPLAPREIDFETAQTSILQDERPEVSEEVRQAAETGAFGGMYGWDHDRQLFIDLQESARFHRRWWLVYVTVLLYLLALYPGCYRLGRRAGDWRLFYAGFLGVCVVFSTGFATLGRVGSSERNRVRSAAIARQLEEGLYDVTQWSCLGAVSGDIYSIQHNGSGRLYSSCHELDPVNGAVHLSEGRFDVDLPPASTRSLTHRVRISGPSLQLTLRDLQFDERGLSRCSMSTAPEIQPRVAYVWYREQIYELAPVGESWSIVSRGRPGIMFLNSFEDYWQSANSRWTNPDDKCDKDQIFRSLARNLIGNSFRLQSQVRPKDVSLPEDLMRIFIYAPAPKEFAVSGDHFPDQLGYVMYVVDRPVNQTGPAAIR